MPGYLLAADIHVGNHQQHAGKTLAGINERARAILSVLSKFVDMAWALGARPTIAGDLFDKATPDVRIVTAVREALGLPNSPDELYVGQSEEAVRGHLPIICSGNHDAVSSADNDHALGALGPATVVAPGDVLWDNATQAAFVGYAPGKNGVEQLTEAFEKIPQDWKDLTGNKLLVIHLGIIDQETPPWLKDSSDAIELTALVKLCKENKITHAAAGNWHTRKYWELDGVSVYQIGALVPTGWDNPGEQGYGTALHWAFDSGWNLTEIPGHRFVNVTNLEELDSLNPTNTYFARIKVQPDKVGEVKDEIDSVTLPDCVLSIDVVPVERSASQTAVSAVQGATTLGDALSGATDDPEAVQEALALITSSRKVTKSKPVRVTKIKVNGAGNHTGSELNLPESGVVLIVGPNGSGKTTLVQATPLTLWEQPTGDRPPIWTTAKPEVSVVIDGVTYTRTPSNRPRLTWTNGPIFERKADAQAEIESQFGTLEQWSRLSLLDGSISGFLTTAGPSDRRRLITEMAGLEGLDSAYETAAIRKKTADKELSAALVASSNLVGQLTGLQTLHIPVFDADELTAKLKRLAELGELVEDAKEELQEAKDIGADLKTKKAIAEARLAGLFKLDTDLSSGVCPTCKQEVPQKGLHNGVVHNDSMEVAAEVGDLEVKIKLQVGVVTKLSQEVANLVAKQQIVSDECSTLKATKQAAGKNKEVKDSIVAVQQQLTGAKQLEAKLTQVAQRAGTVASLLSPNGPRGKVLSSFCEALSEQASRLLRIAYGADAWVLVQIAPKGVELTSSLGPSPSRGQLRRLDIALAVASLLIEEALAGRGPSTMWADEIFEVLDPDGVAGCAKILESLSKDRAVVIVAHNAADQLRACATAIYQVDNSSVTKVK